MQKICALIVTIEEAEQKRLGLVSTAKNCTTRKVCAKIVTYRDTIGKEKSKRKDETKRQQNSKTDEAQLKTKWKFPTMKCQMETLKSGNQRFKYFLNNCSANVFNLKVVSKTLLKKVLEMCKLQREKSSNPKKCISKELSDLCLILEAKNSTIEVKNTTEKNEKMHCLISALDLNR